MCIKYSPLEVNILACSYLFKQSFEMTNMNDMTNAMRAQQSTFSVRPATRPEADPRRSSTPVPSALPVPAAPLARQQLHRVPSQQQPRPTTQRNRATWTPETEKQLLKAVVEWIGEYGSNKEATCKKIAGETFSNQFDYKQLKSKLVDLKKRFEKEQQEVDSSGNGVPDDVKHLYADWAGISLLSSFKFIRHLVILFYIAYRDEMWPNYTLGEQIWADDICTNAPVTFDSERGFTFDSESIPLNTPLDVESQILAGSTFADIDGDGQERGETGTIVSFDASSTSVPHASNSSNNSGSRRRSRPPTIDGDTLVNLTQQKF